MTQQEIIDLKKDIKVSAEKGQLVLFYRMFKIVGIPTKVINKAIPPRNASNFYSASDLNLDILDPFLEEITLQRLSFALAQPPVITK